MENSTYLGWYTLETDVDKERFVNVWGIDAPTDELGAMLLDIAKTQVLAYAPAIADCDPTDPLCPFYAVSYINGVDEDGDGEDGEMALSTEAPKPRLVFAQLQQAKNLWNAGRANPNGELGAGEFTYTPRPLDKTIREMIRPRRGVPSVF